MASAICPKCHKHMGCALESARGAAQITAALRRVFDELRLTLLRVTRLDVTSLDIPLGQAREASAVLSERSESKGQGDTGTLFGKPA